MNLSTHKTGRKKEEGVALFIAIFVLLIISAVAVAMVMSSGSESKLAGNYRAATKADFAAQAGLEEARGRLLPTNPNYFNKTFANFVPNPGTPLSIGQVRYIINQAPGETVAPWAISNLATYPDNEYLQEFGVNVPAGQPFVTSVTALNGGATPGPSFKWVRLTPATEQSLGINVDNRSGALDNTFPLYYDGSATPHPSLLLSTTPLVPTAPTSTSQGVTEITALAVAPGGGEKLLRYVVAPLTFTLNFPSALNFGANNMTFKAASSSQYQVNGTDGSGNPGTVPGCTPNAPTVDGIGATNPGDVNTIVSAIPTGSGGNNRTGNYIGTGGTPSVGQVSLTGALSSPAQVAQLVQQITQNADVVINGNATQANMPSAMSATNPMTVVVNGDFSMNGTFTGYGLLVVTGNFQYGGDDGWKGIVLVVGDGTTTYTGQGGGHNEFDGAIFVATIWDANHNLLAAFGPDQYDISGGGGNGVYYNSCWIQQAEHPSSFKVLSFKEIPYND